jgi:hypothetical protein
MTTKPTPKPMPYPGHARCSECGMGEKQGHVATCSKVQRWTPQTARDKPFKVVVQSMTDCAACNSDGLSDCVHQYLPQEVA